MNAHYGFQATMSAKAGKGDELVELLMTGLMDGNPASTDYCLVYLISRSAADPDVVHLTEGWTSEEDHHRLFAGEAAQAMVAKFESLLEGESVYTDFTPVDGKLVA